MNEATITFEELNRMTAKILKDERSLIIKQSFDRTVRPELNWPANEYTRRR
jgi:hypothetical protein